MGLLYSGTQLQNHAKKALYTNKATGVKNRKYLLRYLGQKFKVNEDYSLIGIYLGLEELNLKHKEKNEIVKKINSTLSKHLPVKCEIIQVSGSCLVLVLDLVSNDTIQSTSDRVDKLLLELNIGDSQKRLEYQINSINSLSQPGTEPEALLDSLLKDLS